MFAVRTMAISTAISCLCYSVFTSVAVILPPQQQLCRLQTELPPPSILNHGGQHGFPSLYRHAEEFLPVLAGQGQRIFPRCRHEKSPEALCFRLHCCPGEMGSCRQTMDSEHLHEEQMATLPDHIQCQLRMSQTFWRGCRL